MNAIHRREFIKTLGLSAASLPFLLGLPSLGLASPARPRQRLIVMFSPNGTIPPAYWPDEVGSDFKLKENEKRDFVQQHYATCLDVVENGGHRFGEDLSEADKKAVTAFLATL